MPDQELIELVAKTWVENGGDAKGIEFCWWRIRDAVKRLREETIVTKSGTSVTK